MVILLRDEASAPFLSCTMATRGDRMSNVFILGVLSKRIFGAKIELAFNFSTYHYDDVYTKKTRAVHPAIPGRTGNHRSFGGTPMRENDDDKTPDFRASKIGFAFV